MLFCGRARRRRLKQLRARVWCAARQRGEPSRRGCRPTARSGPGAAPRVAGRLRRERARRALTRRAALHTNRRLVRWLDEIWGEKCFLTTTPPRQLVKRHPPPNRLPVVAARRGVRSRARVGARRHCLPEAGAVRSPPRLARAGPLPSAGQRG